MRRLHSGKISISLASLGFMTCLVAGLLAAAAINSLLKSQLASSLAHLEDRLGFSLNIEHRALSFGRLDFKGITIGDEAVAVVGHVAADFDMNPLSSSFARPTNIQIKNLNIKVTTTQLASLSKPRAMTPKSSNPSFTSRSRQNTKIQLRDSRLSIVSPDGEHLLSLTRYHADIDLEQGFGHAKLMGTTIGDKLLENELYLNWRKNADNTRTLGVLKPMNNPSWQLSAQLDHVSKDILTAFNSTGLPKWLMGKDSRLAQFVYLEDAPIQSRARLRLDRINSRLEFSGFVYAKDVVIEHSSLSSTPLGPIPLSLQAQGHINLEEPSLTVTDGTFALKSHDVTYSSDPFVRLKTTANLSMSNNTSLLKINLELPPTSCQKVFNIIPSQASQQLSELTLTGSVSGSFLATIDLTNSSIVSTRMPPPTQNCSVEQGSSAFSIAQLRNSQTLSFRPDRGLTLGPHTRAPSQNFLSYPYIPRTVQLAFVASEDTGFWQHQGVEWGMLTAALRHNLSAGRVKVGASTISMQTAKNLFLTHDRTLVRKIEELALTWHLERHLSKERIFEIYVNVIEYGPNIFGLSDAARIIFGKPAYQLNLAESSFLSALLPNPKARFSHVCRGSLSPEFKSLIAQRMERLASNGQIQAQHHQDALMHLEQIKFNPRVQNNPLHCNRLRNETSASADTQNKPNASL